MKKIMVALLMATLLVGSAFAEITFGGMLDTGFALQLSGDATEDNGPVFYPWSFDANGYAFRVNLNATATNADGNAGARFRFRVDNTTAGLIKVPYADGWWKPIDSLKIMAGLIDDGTFGTMGTAGFDAGEGLGTMFVLTASDLLIGAGAYYGNFVTSSNEVTNQAVTPVFLQDAKYTFGVKYTVPSLVAVAASFRTGEAKNTTDADALPYNMNEASTASFGASVLAVPNLQAVLEMQLARLDDFSEVGTTTITETFRYTLDTLQVGLNGRERLFQADGKETAIVIHPWVQYTTGKFVPRLDFVYGINCTPNPTRMIGIDEGNVLDTNGGTKEASGMIIRPSLQYNIDGSTYVAGGFVFNLVQLPNVDDVSNSYFTVNVRWSF
jgi:hypothetical protein